MGGIVRKQRSAGARAQQVPPWEEELPLSRKEVAGEDRAARRRVGIRRGGQIGQRG